MSRRLLITSVLSLACLCASGQPFSREILANEQQQVYESAILGQRNLFCDEIPLEPNARLIRKSLYELDGLSDRTLIGYEAVFTVYRASGKPLTFRGALMPGGESLEDLHSALMFVKASEKEYARLMELPEGSIIYASDETGNKAWCPVRWLSRSGQYAGYLEGRALYAYTYRPSDKLLGRYGKNAYYLNILNPELIEQALLVDEDRIKLYTSGLSPNLEKIAYYNRTAVLAPLVKEFSRSPELITLDYQLTLAGDTDVSEGLVQLRVPSGLSSYREGSRLYVRPDERMLRALDTYHRSVVSDLGRTGKTKDSVMVAGLTRVLSLYSPEGEIKLSRGMTPGGLEPWPTVLLTVPGHAGAYALTATVEDDGRLFVFDVDPDLPAYAALERFLGPGDDRSVITGPRQEGTYDWREHFDTSFHGAAVKPAPAADRRAVVIPFERQFELDQLPLFYTDGETDFSRWIYSRIQYPYQAALLGLEGRVTLEFVIEKTGLVSGVRISQGTHIMFAEAVLMAMSSPIQWVPGEIAGQPVNVAHRMDIDFTID